jgi:hypothetical protein
MIEVSDLLAEDEVFQERWATLTSSEHFLISNRPSDVRCHVTLGIVDLKLRELVSREAFRPGGEIADARKGTLSLDNGSEANGSG